jgi:sodium transport system permease protein
VRSVLTVLKKELWETLRDPMVLIMSLGFPIVFFPLLIWGMSQLTMLSTGTAEREPPRIAVVGAEAPGPGGLVDALSVPPALQTQGSPSDVQDGSLDLHIEVLSESPGLSLALTHNSTLPRSQRALKWGKGQLQDVEHKHLEEIAAARDIASGQLEVWAIQTEDISRPSDRMVSIVSKSMPMILMVMLLIATVSPAVDIFVGERERGTLETSLVTARSRWPLILGKVLAASVIGMVGMVGNLGAGGLTLVHTLHTMGVGDGQGLHLEPVSMLMCILPLVSGALLIAALSFVAVVPARTFKQAQSLSSWVIIGAMAVIYTGATQDEAPELWMGLIPVRNLMHCLTEALRGSLAVNMALTSTAVNLALASGLLWVVYRVMGHEGYLFGPEDSGWRDALRSLLPRRRP